MITFMLLPLASMHKTPVFTARLLLCGFFSEPFCTLGAGFWGVRGKGGDDNAHVIAFGEHAQNTGIYGTSASTC